jgi:hypothetical protein
MWMVPRHITLEYFQFQLKGDHALKEKKAKRKPKATLSTPSHRNNPTFTLVPAVKCLKLHLTQAKAIQNYNRERYMF